MFGALFTVGFVYAIKNPFLYRESYDFALAPIGDRDVEANPLRIDERLRRLQGLRDEGLITEEGYQRQRAAILHGL